MVNGREACGDRAPLVFITPFPSPVSRPAMTQSTCYHLLLGAVRFQGPRRFPGQSGSLSTCPLPPSLAKGPCSVEWGLCMQTSKNQTGNRTLVAIFLPKSPVFSFAAPLPDLPTSLSSHFPLSSSLPASIMPWMFWAGPGFLGHPKWVSGHSWLSSATLAAQTQPPASADLVWGNWRGKQVFSQALLSNQWAPDSASFGPRQPALCSPVYSRPRGISMGYLGGQQQVGTGTFSAVGRKGTLVGVLPLTLLPAPRTRVPCAYQPPRGNNKSPQGLW